MSLYGLRSLIRDIDTTDNRPRFVYNDYGVPMKGKKESTVQATCRAIAIGTLLPYTAVLETLTWERDYRLNQRKQNVNKLFDRVRHEYLLDLGWTWVVCAAIGTGCRVHLKREELPHGRIIVRVSKYLTTMIDGQIHDVFDVSRERPSFTTSDKKEGKERAIYGRLRI